MISKRYASSLKIGLVIILFALPFMSTRVLAQNVGNSTRMWQAGAFFGRGLPYGLSQNDEIFTIWGLRISPPIPGTQRGFFDGTYTSGAGSAVTWQELSVGLSLEEPVETLFLGMGIGFDAIRFTTDLLSGPHIVSGYYLLGSAMTNITPSLLARFDLTMNYQPVPVYMVDLGLVYQFQ